MTRIKLMTAVSCAVLAWGAVGLVSPALADMTPQNVKEIIESYLKEKPEIIVEAMEELNRRQSEEKAKNQSAAIQEHQKDLLDLPASPVLGNPHGALVIVSFMDYNCGHCRRAHDDLAKVLTSHPDLKIIVKDLPVLSKSSYQAALAARAAGKQGKFFEFQNALMQSHDRLNHHFFKEAARILGLNLETFEKDYRDPALAQELEHDIQLAEALGIDGTPTFVVAGKVIEGYPGTDEILKALVNRDAVAGSAVGHAVAQALVPAASSVVSPVASSLPSSTPPQPSASLSVPSFGAGTGAASVSSPAVATTPVPTVPAGEPLSSVAVPKPEFGTGDNDDLSMSDGEDGYPVESAIEATEAMGVFDRSSSEPAGGPMPLFVPENAPKSL